jgi:protein-tyrosine phosphatase
MEYQNHPSSSSSSPANVEEGDFRLLPADGFHKIYARFGIEVSPTGNSIAKPKALVISGEDAKASEACKPTISWNNVKLDHSSKKRTVLTSEERPLTVSCIDLPPLSGDTADAHRMIGFCMAMGRTKQKDGYAWARDMKQDIHRLKEDYRADVLVTMMPLTELSEIGAKDLPDLVQHEGMEWLHFGIVDKFVPTQGVAAFKHMAGALAERLRNGRRVVLHCNGGKGRSALMTAAVVHCYSQGTDTPLTMAEAIARVRASSTGALRNPLQVTYLHACEYAPGDLIPSVNQWVHKFTSALGRG